MNPIPLEHLNPQQREAVLCYQGPLQIIAGAGTGKTRVITTRIAYMLAKGIPPGGIAAMTFTNKAAKEMRERLQGLVHKHDQKLSAKVFMGTFHKFCIMLLREWHETIQLDRRFKIINQNDQLEFIRKAYAEANLPCTGKPEDTLAQISLFKGNLKTPADVLSMSNIEKPEELHIVYSFYNRYLQLNHAIDFDDCIFKAVELLRDHPEVCAQIRAKYPYILVDEYQDTSLSQLTILECLVPRDGNICVVGDDDQSIYSWRGAMYETIARFGRSFPTFRMIKLEQNYRSTSPILDAANTVIRNNAKRQSKSLWSSRADKAPLELYSFSHPEEEAAMVARRCRNLQSSGVALSDIVVLYRTNGQSREIEQALMEKHLPCKVYGGKSFFGRREVQDYIAYLRTVSNPQDTMAFWRIINTPPRGIGIRTQEKLKASAKEAGLSPLPYLLYQHEQGTLGNAALSSFADKISTLSRERLHAPDEVRKFCGRILDEFELSGYYRSQSKNEKINLDRIQRLNSIPTWLERYSLEWFGEEKSISVQQLVDAVSLEDPSDQEEERNHISLMTVHAAKGLEFQYVFLVGLEDGVLPHKNSLKGEALDEERRLFYVGITRAKKHLILSYSQGKILHNTNHAQQPSRFLRELPETDLERHIYNSEEEINKRRSKTLSCLSSLKQELMGERFLPQ